MNRSKLAQLIVAVLCITAIGVSATTLNSSLSTDPDDEIDLSYDKLPIGQEDAIAIQEQMQASGDEPESGGDGQQQSASSEAASDSASSSNQETSMGVGPSPPSLLDRLLAFLLSILRFVLSLVVILGLAAIAYRYRDRILGVVWDRLQPTDDPADVEYERQSWPDGSPSNAVERAWLTLVRRVDPERPAIMTPAECAAAAREAGLEAAPVETITSAFERVEYGGVPADEEEDRVEDALQRLNDGRGIIGSRGSRGHHSHRDSRGAGGRGD